MATMRQVRVLGEIARDLDMVVFQMERGAADDPPALTQERRRVRRELERLRDQLNDVVRELE